MTFILNLSIVTPVDSSEIESNRIFYNMTEIIVDPMTKHRLYISYFSYSSFYILVNLIHILIITYIIII